ncbi:heme-dependent oxidative N-demethylase family protein [Leptolyngbya ohadii]|uniref:heme-dependent oxidative N-demethylase family protein n=1 Tax=Leptolyngbya ohadii TaxID=1962290 RepID=UPI000B5A0102|nr:DUF3445 domain-containing protein [Leptolyngbya ohadii]
MPRSIESSVKPGRWLSLGLQPLDECEWLEIEADALQQIELKRQLMNDRHDEVLASLPESIAAQQEVLDLLIAHLLQHYPQQYRQEGNQLHHDLTGQRWKISEFRQFPLELAGRLVPEDWCVLLPSENSHRDYVLMAGAVCFPFRWRLQDKLGRSLSGIHAPVPGYAKKLSRPVNSVFDRLRSDYPSVRFNWGIADTPSLFLPATHSETPADPTISIENAGCRLWLRIERQTLRRLPDTGGIVFGIRTTIESLQQIKADAVRANHLLEAIEQLPPTAQSYKSLLPLQSVLLSYLRG